MKAILITALLLSFANTAALAAEEIDCKGVRIDAEFGAQQARNNVSRDDAIAAIERSIQTIDTELVKTKRKPMSTALKANMRKAFFAGFQEAIKQPNETVERIAGQIGFACMIEKHK